MTRRILLLDSDRPDEALEVDVLARDEVVLAVAVPNTIVSFDLIRGDDRAPYRGRLGGRSFSFAAAMPDGSKSESASARPKTSTRARSRKPRKSIPNDHAATHSSGVRRKGVLLYGGTG
ncbi:hypothetical protein [Methylosinus sp. PW1]|uniref:hypothetical protein n=1 Tax=Methylosinus sp. PW1 TaxID=107636 RepID=UPI000A4B7349|nr:hypothetical protein [Methylosinus sp. PW1]